MASHKRQKTSTIEVSTAAKVPSVTCSTCSTAVCEDGEEKRKDHPIKTEIIEEKLAQGGAVSDWAIDPGEISLNTINPIRAIVDQLNIPKGGPKPLIPLSIGDPSLFGNLDIPQIAIDSVIKALKSKSCNGYAPSTGLLVAREAIAAKLSCPSSPIASQDVIIASGCSGALTLAIQALASPGDNILVPRPGFSLYATICGHSKVEYRYYDLLPDNNWEVDLDSLERQIDKHTKAIVINNPSNPCGANYSKVHLTAILRKAEKYRIPIIADEIYGYMVFKGETFHPMATLTSEVPILACGGLAKQYVMPGWRVGWVTVHDKRCRFKAGGIPDALQRLSTLILGANTVAQGAVPDILHTTPSEYYTHLMDTLERQAGVLIRTLETIDGLTCIIPQGAMYLMVRIDPSKFRDIPDEMVFSQLLLDEEMLFVLPGSCFQAPNYFRMVFCAPDSLLLRACDRLKSFCDKHHV